MTSKKRKSVFTWIQKQKADLIFVQETYSTAEVIKVSITPKFFFRQDKSLY